MSTSSTPTPTASTFPHEALHLQADIRKVLEHVVASHEEQKKMSKGVDELTVKIKVLERVLCGDVGCPRKNMDPLIIQKGGLVQRLVDMEAAIDNLLGLVTCLKTDVTDLAPLVYRDTSVSACARPPSVQSGYVYNSTDLPETLPSSTRLLRPLFPPLRCSPDPLNPINWNANPPNSRHVSLLGFSVDGYDRSLSSSLATPSPDSPRSEYFGRPNGKSTSSSLASSQSGLGSLHQNLPAASPSCTSNPSPADVTHTAASSSIPPKFNSRNSVSNSQSKTVPIPPTPSQLSHYTHTAIVNATSTTRTPNSALSRARAASLGRILFSTQPNIEEDVGCEGLCADCKAERMGQQERQDHIMDPPELHTPITDSSGQDRNNGTNTSSDTSFGELHSPLRPEADANTETSLPVLGTVLGVGPTTPDTQPIFRTSSDDALHAAARENEDVEPRVPGAMWTREAENVNGDVHSPEPDKGMQLDHVTDAVGSSEANSDHRRELGRETIGGRFTQQNLQSEHEGLDGLLDEYAGIAEEKSVTAVAQNIGDSNQQILKTRYQGFQNEQSEELLTDPEDDAQAENILSKSCQPTPDAPRVDADDFDQYQPHAEASRESTPADSLLQDEEDVAAVLAATPDSPEDTCMPRLSSTPHLSALPLQPEPEAQNEHMRLGMQDQGRNSTEPQEEHDHDDHGYFVAHNQAFADLFTDFMNADAPTSALRDTLFTEAYAGSQVQELAATTDQRKQAEIPARSEHDNPDRTVAISPTFPWPSPSPPHSSRASSLSSLSSLEGSPMQLEKEISDRYGRPNGKGVELLRAEGLHSNEEFGMHKTFLRPSRSAPREKVDSRQSSVSLISGGGPGASIEELSMLARKNPPKLSISLSDLKRKLELSGCTIRQAKKRTKFDKDGHKDMGATQLGMDTASSSRADMARDINTEGPIPQSSGPSVSMQDMTSFRVESVSTLMGASASGSGTFSKPETMAELQVNPTQAPKKRVRAVSQKARESVAQKGQAPRKSAGRASKKRAPQKRKSKSLSSQGEEGPTCQWPAKSKQDGLFQRQFVQCDNCNFWYHFGCVGIVEGDARLEVEATFICPPCCISTAKRLTLRNRGEVCARPDCLHANTGVQEYVIERLVGRKPVGQAGSLYLVKWEGYPISQATWTPGGNLEGAPQAFDQFAMDAKAEGINLRKNSFVLLEEARVGGWEA